MVIQESAFKFEDHVLVTFNFDDVDKIHPCVPLHFNNTSIIQLSTIIFYCFHNTTCFGPFYGPSSGKKYIVKT